MRQLLRKTVIFLIAVVPVVHAQGGLPYTTYTSFTQVLEGRNAHVIISPVKVTKESKEKTKEPGPGAQQPAH